MTKKNVMLMFFALVLAVAYVIFFTNWFRTQTVPIYHTYRDLRGAPARGNALPNLIFGLNHPMRLTEIKVVPVAAYETNQNAVAVWHLVSETNSAPVQNFFYGQNIHGMHPAINGVNEDVIQPNVTYRLFLTAGKIKGTNDFVIQ